MRSPVGTAVVLLAGAASIASYAAVSATVNGEPPTSPYPEFVALLQPAGSSSSQEQVKLMASAMVAGGPGQNPSLSYDLAVCGSQAFSGMLLIGGGARLTHLSGDPALGNETPGTSYGVENLPDLTLRDEGTGTSTDLGPVQAVSLTMASPPKCVSAYTIQQPEPFFRGQDQTISGRAAVPVQRPWRLGWWAGPRTGEDWPLIGNLPGIRSYESDEFLALDGLHGAWVRPLRQYNSVSAGGLQTNASVDEAQPPLASDTDLDWDSPQPLQPNAVVTDTLQMNRWQNWLVWAAIFLGIGSALLASLLYEWARPDPAQGDPPRNAAPSQAGAQQTKTALKPFITAVALVILAWAIRSRRR